MHAWEWKCICFVDIPKLHTLLVWCDQFLWTQQKPNDAIHNRDTSWFDIFHFNSLKKWNKNYSMALKLSTKTCDGLLNDSQTWSDVTNWKKKQCQFKKEVQHLQWIDDLTTTWKFLPWTHEISSLWRNSSLVRKHWLRPYTRVCVFCHGVGTL